MKCRYPLEKCILKKNFLFNQTMNSILNIFSGLLKKYTGLHFYSKYTFKKKKKKKINAFMKQSVKKLKISWLQNKIWLSLKYALKKKKKKKKSKLENYWLQRALAISAYGSDVRPIRFTARTVGRTTGLFPKFETTRPVYLHMTPIADITLKRKEFNKLNKELTHGFLYYTRTDFMPFATLKKGQKLFGILVSSFQLKAFIFV